MKRNVLTCFLFILSLQLFGQERRIWKAVYNSDTSLIGYKDSSGRIRIEPKFQMAANQFDQIMAVTEERGGTFQSYYLTKQGKVIGRDSLYIFDNTPDCEEEGFIRFKNRTTDQVGLLNGRGVVVIQAAYSDLTPVRNGLITALKGAKKKYWGNDGHYTWVGGEKLLIDTNNRVLIRDFDDESLLNLFSMLKGERPVQDTIRKNFQAVGGGYYSFIDFESEFNEWLKNTLHKDFTLQELTALIIKDSVAIESPDGWTSIPNTQFVKEYGKHIRAKLLELNQPGCAYFIIRNELNPFLFDTPGFERYYTNCGQAKSWMYPVMDIVISHEQQKHLSQDHLEFLRTEKGYKLISVTIR